MRLPTLTHPSEWMLHMSSKLRKRSRKVSLPISLVLRVVVLFLVAAAYFMTWAEYFCFILFQWLFIRRPPKPGTVGDLQAKLAAATSYREWENCAKRLDDLEGKTEWRREPSSDLYDVEIVKARLGVLRALQKEGDPMTLASSLRTELCRNLGGMGNPHLFRFSRVGTKFIIEEYVATVVSCLRFLHDEHFSDFSLQNKFDFFWETRQAFGRSALLLSGGASLGIFHVGVLKELHEQGLLPRVMSGSSVGSIIAALACSRAPEDLPELFVPGKFNLEAFDRLGPGGLSRKIKRLLTKGVLMDVGKLRDCIRENVGDITFMESFKKSNRILNIVVASTNAHELPLLLNYLTTPDVLVWSAALASCALPGLFESVDIVKKNADGSISPYHPAGVKWSDGSVEADLPMARLSEMFNINHFLVSQVNPHVVPFLAFSASNATSSGIMSKIRFLIGSEISHRLSQFYALGLVPSFLRSFFSITRQQYEGDITIVPRLGLADYARLVSNPTIPVIQEATLKGMRTTWPLVSCIRTHCLIELTLEKCLASLRNRMQHDGTAPEQFIHCFSRVSSVAQRMSKLGHAGNFEDMAAWSLNPQNHNERSGQMRRHGSITDGDDDEESSELGHPGMRPPASEKGLIGKTPHKHHAGHAGHHSEPPTVTPPKAYASSRHPDDDYEKRSPCITAAAFTAFTHQLPETPNSATARMLAKLERAAQRDHRHDHASSDDTPEANESDTTEDSKVPSPKSDTQVCDSEAVKRARDERERQKANHMTLSSAAVTMNSIPVTPKSPSAVPTAPRTPHGRSQVATPFSDSKSMPDLKGPDTKSPDGKASSTSDAKKVETPQTDAKRNDSPTKGDARRTESPTNAKKEPPRIEISDAEGVKGDSSEGSDHLPVRDTGNVKLLPDTPTNDSPTPPLERAFNGSDNGSEMSDERRMEAVGKRGKSLRERMAREMLTLSSAALDLSTIGDRKSDFPQLRRSNSLGDASTDTPSDLSSDDFSGRGALEATGTLAALSRKARRRLAREMLSLSSAALNLKDIAA